MSVALSQPNQTDCCLFSMKNWKQNVETEERNRGKGETRWVQSGISWLADDCQQTEAPS